MRSFDYRCPEGIALFIGKQLESRRDIRQAFGRVARYTDETAPRLLDLSLSSNLVNADCIEKTNQAINKLIQVHTSSKGKLRQINQSNITSFMKNPDQVRSELAAQKEQAASSQDAINWCIKVLQWATQSSNAFNLKSTH